MNKRLSQIKLVFCLGLILSTSLMPLKVLAIDTQFYSKNDIFFSGTDSAYCPAKAAEPTGTAAAANANLEVILRYLTGKGLSLVAATAIAGNLQQESHWNPAVIQGGAIAPDNYTPKNGVGFGLAQWTFTSRQKPLMDLAKSQNKNITDINLQLDFLWQELNTGYMNVLKRLNTVNSSTTFGSTSAVIGATIIFHGITPGIKRNINQQFTDVNPAIGFEGSGDTADQVVKVRGGNAEGIYITYQGQIPDGTGVAEITSGAPASLTSSSPTICGTPASTPAAGGATWPDNVTALGKGWSVKDNVDYSGVQCAAGTTDAGTYTHPTHGFIIRKCSSAVGEVSSLMSEKVTAMITAAASAGIKLTGSSFRPYEVQQRLRVANCADPINTPSASCKPPTAKAGGSQHERGLAIDFSNIATGGAVWNWLVSNGATYGFYNLPSEAWHWSMSGD